MNKPLHLEVVPMVVLPIVIIVVTVTVVTVDVVLYVRELVLVVVKDALGRVQAVTATAHRWVVVVCAAAVATETVALYVNTVVVVANPSAPILVRITHQLLLHLVGVVQIAVLHVQRVVQIRVLMFVKHLQHLHQDVKAVRRLVVTIAPVNARDVALVVLISAHLVAEHAQVVLMVVHRLARVVQLHALMIALANAPDVDPTVLGNAPRHVEDVVVHVAEHVVLVVQVIVALVVLDIVAVDVPAHALARVLLNVVLVHHHVETHATRVVLADALRNARVLAIQNVSAVALNRVHHAPVTAQAGVTEPASKLVKVNV